MITILISVGLIGYVLGAIPFAVIVSRFYGVNILKEGSGNPGATNVKRVVGKTAGNIVFGLDFFKGLMAAGWPLFYLPLSYLINAGLGPNGVVYASIAGLVGAVMGHSYSIFLLFRGGKGIAVTMGGLLALMPFSLLIGIVVWVLAFYGTRYVSVASMLFGLSLPIATQFTSGDKVRVIFSGVLAVFILIRHIPNMQRLWHDEEKKFEKEDKQANGD